MARLQIFGIKVFKVGNLFFKLWLAKGLNIYWLNIWFILMEITRFKSLSVPEQPARFTFCLEV